MTEDGKLEVIVGHDAQELANLINARGDSVEIVSIVTIGVRLTAFVRARVEKTTKKPIKGNK